jgi:hypothetical protein
MKLKKKKSLGEVGRTKSTWSEHIWSTFIHRQPTITIKELKRDCLLKRRWIWLGVDDMYG